MNPFAKRPKYGNRKVEYDGHKFDSRLERDTYIELRLQERAGIITELEVHPRHDFIEIDFLTGKPKLITYLTLDFKYRVVSSGELEFIDTKTWSTRTEAYMLRKRWFECRTGYRVIEVYSNKEKGKR